MATYQQKKETLLEKISKYLTSDDLFELADAEIIINTILRENRFPKREYREWQKKKK